MLFPVTRRAGLLLLLVGSRALAAVVPQLLDKRADTVFPPELPVEDSFYAVPADIARLAPGSILKHRQTPNPIAALGSPIANVAASHQFLYRTTDSFGNATATVLSVIIPKNADFTKVLSYQTASDSAARNCAPSYSIQEGSDPDGTLNNFVVQAEVLFMQVAIQRGWVVITPDFEGPNAAFLANILAGQATLDGIRAALNTSEITGIVPSAKVGLFGYSGGTLASLSAAELQPVYAPEIKLQGVAVGGSEPDLEATLKALKGQGALTATGLIGLSQEYPELKQILSEQLSEDERKTLSVATTRCIAANYEAFGNIDIFELLDAGFFSNPNVTKALHENSLGHRVPDAPVYFYHGSKDAIAPIKPAQKLATQYCYKNRHIKFDVVREFDHATTLFMTYRAFDWLSDRLDGVPLATSSRCPIADSATLEFRDLLPIAKFLGEALGISGYDTYDFVTNIIERITNVLAGVTESTKVASFFEALKAGDYVTASIAAINDIAPALGKLFQI